MPYTKLSHWLYTHWFTWKPIGQNLTLVYANSIYTTNVLYATKYFVLFFYESPLYTNWMPVVYHVFIVLVFLLNTSETWLYVVWLTVVGTLFDWQLVPLCTNCICISTSWLYATQETFTSILCPLVHMKPHRAKLNSVVCQ
jgi:hypothetical protein